MFVLPSVIATSKICWLSVDWMSPTKQCGGGLKNSGRCSPANFAVDDEGEVLDLLMQRRRDKAAAVKLMRKLLKKQGFAPDVLVTDKLPSYGAAKSEMGLSARHEQGLRKRGAHASTPPLDWASSFSLRHPDPTTADRQLP